VDHFEELDVLLIIEILIPVKERFNIVALGV
jgi:hypothetical protein